MSSLQISVPFYKSSSRTIQRWLFISRQRHSDKAQETRKRLADLEQHYRRVVEEKRKLEQCVQRQARELQEAKEEIASLSTAPIKLPADRPLPGHQFGAKMISVCCNLARTVGFRAAEKVMSIVNDWLGTDFDVPSYSSIRLWLCRSGVAALQESAVPQEDWIWLVDHSVQLGETNVLVVLGIRQSELPQTRALRHRDLKTLAILPGTSRSKESVASALSDLAENIGTPIGFIADGATELHEGVKALQNKGQSVLVLDDMKHKAANILKKTLGKEPRFAEFESLTGKTTARIQQTELVHFLPPKKKAKCRFMNLKPLLKWALMVIHHLQNPAASGNDGVAPERLADKLGWVLEFQQELESWQACQDVVSQILWFTNEKGVYLGATRELQNHLDKLPLSADKLSEKVRDQFVDAYRQCEKRLVNSPHAELRFPVSTEVLESTFGRFKQIQRQHNRGSFTSLLAAFPALLEPSTPKAIARQLHAVNNQTLKEWIEKANLNDSTHAKRTRAYKREKSHNLDTKTTFLNSKT